MINETKLMEKPKIWLRFVVALLMFIYFEIGYILSARQDINSAHDGAIFIDALIPIVPAFILFYMLGYLFVFSPCFTLKNNNDFYWGTACFFVVLSITFVIFNAFPVVMYKTIATGNDGFATLTRFQQQADTKFNNFPSLHVSLNTFAFLIFSHNKPDWFWRVLPLPALIVSSTVLVKQHLFIDVIAGLAMAIAAFTLFKYATTHLQRFAKPAFIVSLSGVGVMMAVNNELLHRVYVITSRFVDRTLSNVGVELAAVIVIAGGSWWLVSRYKSKS